MAKGVASGYAPLSCTVTTQAVFEDLEGSGDDSKKRYFRCVCMCDVCVMCVCVCMCVRVFR